MADRTYQELADQAAVKAAAGEPFEITQTEYETILSNTQQPTMVFYGARLHVKPARFRLQGGLRRR